MNSEKNSIPNENDFSVPRPGHADLAGGMKFATKDLRDILERASARETAIRVAISVPARNLLEKVGIKSLSFVSRIGEIGAEIPEKVSFETLMSVMEKADPAFLTPDPKIIPAWKALVDRCHKLGDTLGGALEIRVGGLPPGLGSHVHWDRRLDGRLAHAVMSLPGVKAVEIGDGISISRKFGSEARDEITYSRKTGFHRIANHSGGLEGGITNGEQLVVRCSMKPIPSIKMGFSIDVRTHKRAPVPVVRSDTVAVHALAVAAESVVILELAGAFLEKFGGDSLEETNRNFTAFKKVLKSY